MYFISENARFFFLRPDNIFVKTNAKNIADVRKTQRNLHGVSGTDNRDILFLFSVWRGISEISRRRQIPEETEAFRLTASLIKIQWKTKKYPAININFAASRPDKRIYPGHAEIAAMEIKIAKTRTGQSGFPSRRSGISCDFE